MELSYWEYKSWLANIDFTIIGSGIVGLSCAIQLKKRFPEAKVLVLEKGMLPQGASTKNAGFACFGSISEVLSDLKNHSEEEVVSLVDQRYKGIQRLRTMLGDRKIGYLNLGGHELFLEKDQELFDRCMSEMEGINKLLAPIFGKPSFVLQENRFKFQGIQPHYITHQFEGQIDTGNMMLSLVRLAQREGILILNNCPVTSYVESGKGVTVITPEMEIDTNKLFIATNGFASTLTKELVQPARAQVLITAPIEGLKLKGTFHFDEGYFYFRNIDNRVLFGGGRNLDFQTETTTDFGQTAKIQNALEELLKTVILPDTPFQIDQRWSGIMGVGQQKNPIVKQLSNHVYCGVRLGGMGIAIGSLVGHELAMVH